MLMKGIYLREEKDFDVTDIVENRPQGHAKPGRHDYDQ